MGAGPDPSKGSDQRSSAVGFAPTWFRAALKQASGMSTAGDSVRGDRGRGSEHPSWPR